MGSLTVSEPGSGAKLWGQFLVLILGPPACPRLLGFPNAPVVLSMVWRVPAANGRARLPPFPCHPPRPRPDDMVSRRTCPPSWFGWVRARGVRASARLRAVRAVPLVSRWCVMVATCLGERCVQSLCLCCAQCQKAKHVVLGACSICWIWSFECDCVCVCGRCLVPLSAGSFWLRPFAPQGAPCLHSFLATFHHSHGPQGAENIRCSTAWDRSAVDGPHR